MDLMKWPIFSLMESDFVSQIRMACVFGMYSTVLLFNYVPFYNVFLSHYINVKSYTFIKILSDESGQFVN